MTSECHVHLCVRAHSDIHSGCGEECQARHPGTDTCYRMHPSRPHTHTLWTGHYQAAPSLGSPQLGAGKHIQAPTTPPAMTPPIADWVGHGCLSACLHFACVRVSVSVFFCALVRVRRARALCVCVRAHARVELHAQRNRMVCVCLLLMAYVACDQLHTTYTHACTHTQQSAMVGGLYGSQGGYNRSPPVSGGLYGSQGGYSPRDQRQHYGSLYSTFGGDRQGVYDLYGR